MNFREAVGREVGWEQTGLESGFSNFLFVDQHYGSNTVLRRIFSQARQHKYQSALIESVSEGDCSWLVEENRALATRRSDFQKAEVHRINFLLSPKNQQPRPEDFLGYAIFKWDYFSTEGKPRASVFESVMRPVRQNDQNNYIHCARTYQVNTSRV